MNSSIHGCHTELENVLVLSNGYLLLQNASVTASSPVGVFAVDNATVSLSNSVISYIQGAAMVMCNTLQLVMTSSNFSHNYINETFTGAGIAMQGSQSMVAGWQQHLK